jgi:Holliday junction resolvase RusA-like endonuclease
MGAVRMTQRSKWKDNSAQRYLSYKRVIGLEARKHFKAPAADPVNASIEFFYPIPASWSKKKRQEAIDGKRLPTVKPDIDNCVKGIFDSLNKIAWNDDNLVTGLQTKKYYSDHPRIVIRVEAA